MKNNMTKERRTITVRELVDGYNDNGVNGVYAYKGRLDVRPPFQREFVYDDKKRNKIIDTIIKDRPLPNFHWSKKLDGTYEIIDGQQRTISICQFITGEFSYVDGENHVKSFNGGLTEEEREQLLDYELDVYIWDGTEREKLDWFKTINIQGAVLTEQELRNAVYSGRFVTDARTMFSKNDCSAQKMMEANRRQLLTGSAIRQDWLETVLKWRADREDLDIDEYMQFNRLNDAQGLWQYFLDVYEWCKTLFPVYRKEMKGVPWGLLYNKYHKETYDPYKLETRVKELMMDDDVTNKKGIYTYLFTGEEKHLSIRQFTERMKREAYERQQGICPHCAHEHREKTHYEFEEMEADHTVPWHKSGRTISENCQMLCMMHNRQKSGN